MGSSLKTQEPGFLEGYPILPWTVLHPLWLSVSSSAKSWTTDYNSSLEPKPIEGKGKYYSKAWMRDQIERKICHCWFLVKQIQWRKELLALRDLPRGLVWEILTHQEMALSWISTNKNIHAKDKSAELCAHQPQEETASRQPAAFAGDLLSPSPNYRDTSWFSVSLTFLTLFLKKHTFLYRMPQWKENRPSIFRPQFAKSLELFFFYF